MHIVTDLFSSTIEILALTAETWLEIIAKMVITTHLYKGVLYV